MHPGLHGTDDVEQLRAGQRDEDDRARGRRGGAGQQSLGRGDSCHQARSLAGARRQRLPLHREHLAHAGPAPDQLAKGDERRMAVDVHAELREK